MYCASWFCPPSFWNFIAKLDCYYEFPSPVCRPNWRPFSSWESFTKGFQAIQNLFSFFFLNKVKWKNKTKSLIKGKVKETRYAVFWFWYPLYYNQNHIKRKSRRINPLKIWRIKKNKKWKRSPKPKGKELQKQPTYPKGELDTVRRDGYDGEPDTVRTDGYD